LKERKEESRDPIGPVHYYFSQGYKSKGPTSASLVRCEKKKGGTRFTWVNSKKKKKSKQRK